MPTSDSSATNTIAARCAMRKLRARTQRQPSPPPARINAKPATTNSTKAKCRTRIASAGIESAARHRALRIRAPLAPRARIEPSAGQARDLHGEEVLAGGDARAAVVDGLVRRPPREHLLELAAK